jgi:hypothetical protein
MFGQLHKPNPKGGAPSTSVPTHCIGGCVNLRAMWMLWGRESSPTAGKLNLHVACQYASWAVRAVLSHASAYCICNGGGDL